MKKITLSIYLVLTSLTTIFAQSTEPFLVEAESGTLGSDYGTAENAGNTYVYPKTDYAATTNPGNDSKVITYSITFPEASTYDLYVKLYIGAADVNDDSFYTPRSVGSKTSNLTDDWVKVNGLNNIGQTLSTETVTGEQVSEIVEQWKWVNVSLLHNTGTKWNYSVEPGALTTTFQIGAREDGLWIDKLVFGKTGTTYTVAELEKAATLSTSKFNTLESVKVYPNPSSTAFNIVSQEKSTSYKIYNILGAKVEEGVLNFGRNTYGNNLKAGTYILDMTSNKKRKVMKLIKF